jgi:hypothetical protein
MLANSHLTNVKAISYVDYRKMTNGFVSVRNAHARSHYPTGLDTTRGGLAPSQGARLLTELVGGIEANGRDGARPSKGMDWDSAARFTLTLRQAAVMRGRVLKEKSPYD